MDHNNICNIRDAPFNGLSRLRVLSLKHNRMTTVAESVFQRLRSNVAVLDIDGNPLSCSCKMLWLQSWLKDTDSEGPRCADGTLFREARLSRTECASSRIVEPVVPGCESEIIQGSVVETSQLSSLVSDPKTNSSQGPLPHESEYFYDEYVEYQYEEVNSTDGQNTTENGHTSKQSSPHLVSGDTPTIYARPIPQLNLTNPGLGFNDLQKVKQQQQQQQSGYSGLSFFGIPLPSLSFGNLWKGNAGRSAEQSQARTPFPKGKIQLVSKQFETKNTNQTFSSPNFESGGFTPVLPESGGFVPMSERPDTRTQSTAPPYRVEMLPDLEKPSDDYVSFPEKINPTKPKNLGKIEPVKKQEEVIEKHAPVEILSEKPYISKVYTNTEIIIAAENDSNPFPRETTEIKDYRSPIIDVPSNDFRELQKFTTERPELFSFESTTRNYANFLFPSPDISSNEIPKIEPVSNQQFSSRNDWYFQNYNRTDLQPYIGSNSVWRVKSSYQVLILASLCFLLI